MPILARVASRILRVLLACAPAACFTLSPASAAGITGSYTGTYSSFISGGDAGTVTLTIDSYGDVSCDFYSTAKATHSTATGSANASPGGSFSVYPVGQPPPPPTPLTRTSVNCVNGPKQNDGGPNNDGSNPAPTYFAAQIIFEWAPGDGVVSSGFGTWVTATGDMGQFQINFQPAAIANAAVNAAALTGLWYDPVYTGSGFNITGSTAGLIVTYYGWDQAGHRLWLSSAIGPTQIVLGQRVDLGLVQTVGGDFSAPAAPSTNAAWGTLSLTFNTCTSATAVLTGSDGASTQSLTLLAGLSGLGCQ